MDRIKQYNEEQYQMLCLAISGTDSGICLFKSDNAKEQAAVAQRLCRDVKKSCCVLDMSETEPDKMPCDIGKMRDLLIGMEGVEVVILYNLQLCGEAFGDENYIQRFNYMRDQLVSMRKVWVFGMTNYFAIMLSREARDLYSCIMNHFEFVEEEKESPLAFEQLELIGDKKRSLLKFNELQERLTHPMSEDTKIERQLELITEWNRIYDCCSGNTNRRMKEIVLNVDEHMRHITFLPKDCIVFSEVAKAWSYLGDYNRALDAGKLILANAENLLPALGKEMADINCMIGIIYWYLKAYDKAEMYINKALHCYETQKGSQLSKLNALNIIAQIKLANGEREEAVHMYEQMIQKVERDYGTHCQYLIKLWNNLGMSYAKSKNYSEALSCFQKADEISAEKEEYINFRYHILNNIGIIYGVIGDYKKAVDYLEEAKRNAEKLDMPLIDAEKKNRIEKILEDYGKKIC